MTNNPFATTEAWDVSPVDVLPVGNHVCKIEEIDGDGNSSGGYPQIELRCSNDQGSIRDWLVITPATHGKIVQLIQAAGMAPPADNEVDPGDHRIAREYLQRMLGKSIGVLVREEDDRMNPGQKRTRVKGYVTPDKITGTAGSDVTGPENVQAFSSAPAPTTPDIPF